MNAKTRAFLRAIEALCREHDATISGCGCCGSPSVSVGDEYVDDVHVLVGDVLVRDGDGFKKVRLDQPTLVIDDEISPELMNGS